MISTETEILQNYLDNTPSNELDILAFVKERLPHLLSNAGLSSFLFSSASEALKGDALLSALKMLTYAEAHRPHTKGEQVDHYKVYSLFADPRMKLNEHEFTKAFDCFFMTILSSEDLDGETRVYKAISDLFNLGETQEEILDQLISLLKNPAAPLFSIGASAKDLDPDLKLQRMAEYTSIKQRLMPIRENIFDALCATFVDLNSNDVSLENTAVFNSFIKTIDNSSVISSPIVIIEPTPCLIKKLRRNNPVKDRQMVFVMANEKLAALYQSLFSRSKFSFITKSACLQQLNSGILVPSDVLLFNNHVTDLTTKTEYIDVFLSNARNTHKLHVFDSDYAIKNTIARDKLPSTICVDSILLFPSGIHNATSPQMKMLVSCAYGYCSINESVTIRHYKLTSNSHYQCLLPYAYQGHMKQSELTNFILKPRTVFHTQQTDSQTKNKGSRSVANTFQFTTEIAVQYSLSGEGTTDKPYRMAAYFQDPSTRKKLYESEKRTKKVSPGDAANWIETNYLNDGTIRQLISASLLNYYKGKDITLKSFIYLDVDFTTELSPTSKRDLDLIKDSILAEYKTGEISFEDAQAVFLFNSRCYPLLLLLSRIIDRAVKMGLCKNNPIKRELQKIKSDHTGLYEVNTNLTKKHLKLNEFKTIYNTIMQKTKTGSISALASLVCLLTGLDANIVAALKIRDLKVIEFKPCSDLSFLQLIIQRQQNNDGSEYQRFSRTEQYRKVPCPSILRDILLQRKEEVEHAHIGMPDDYCMDLRIFPESLTPEILRKNNRKLIQSTNIPPELIPVPDDRKGTVETNLANYRGDLFRTNIDYYARHFGLFEAGEIEYLLGIQASTTFSRHYCDYGNDYAQLILYRKMERILFTLSERDFVAEIKTISEETQYSTMPDHHNRTFLGIDINTNSNTDITITVDTLFGATIQSQKDKESYD